MGWQCVGGPADGHGLLGFYGAEWLPVWPDNGLPIGKKLPAVYVPGENGKALYDHELTQRYRKYLETPGMAVFDEDGKFLGMEGGNGPDS